MRDLINLYVYFITGVVLIMAFLVNFFGKSAIKKRVEELIAETAQKHIETKIIDTLNSKITNELIEEIIKNKSEDEINKIIKSIEKEGYNAINQIKTKGDEAIKSMLSSPPKIQHKTEKLKHTDIEIIERKKDERSKEFFNLAYNSNDPRVQIELYKKVLDLEPHNISALNNMAVSHINLNEPDEAIEILNMAIEINPDYYQAYSNRAAANNLKENLEMALKDAEIVIHMEPRFEYAYSIKGNILTKLGKLPEAEITLNTAIEINPNSGEAFFNRAYFYETIKEYDKSQFDYEKAELLGIGNKALLYNNMAVLFRRIKQFEKAKEFLEKARQFNPNFPNIDGTLALIYADENNDEQFYNYLRIALEKGCQAWNYLSDYGFDKYRNTDKLNKLIDHYKKKFFA